MDHSILKLVLTLYLASRQLIASKNPQLMWKHHLVVLLAFAMDYNRPYNKQYLFFWTLLLLSKQLQRKELYQCLDFEILEKLYQLHILFDVSINLIENILSSDFIKEIGNSFGFGVDIPFFMVSAILSRDPIFVNSRNK